MTMSRSAQDYISAFRRGEDFKPPSAGLIVNGQPDPGALQELEKELTGGDAHVREQIVSVLVELGRRTDPITSKGADVIGNAQILTILAGPGLAKSDLGREAAMDALRKLVIPRDLNRFSGAIVKTLENGPSEEAFLLVAKAKAQGAKSVVERLSDSPRWRDDEAAQIARAALGAEEVENEFLNVARDADKALDGMALGRALGSLGLIGTPRSLRVVAEHLRTPLTILIPGAMEKSVRVSALEALLYNYPDQPALYPNNVNDDAGYELAERFCIQTLGVSYDGPRPPFMKYRPFPIPVGR